MITCVFNYWYANISHGSVLSVVTIVTFPWKCTLLMNNGIHGKYYFVSKVCNNLCNSLFWRNVRLFLFFLLIIIYTHCVHSVYAIRDAHFSAAYVVRKQGSNVIPTICQETPYDLWFSVCTYFSLCLCVAYKGSLLSRVINSLPGDSVIRETESLFGCCIYVCFWCDWEHYYVHNDL